MGSRDTALNGQAPGGLGSRMVFVDVLRAIAILTVLVHHLHVELGAHYGKFHEWGGRGVDLFFILSGFLIGSTCLDRASAPDVGRVQQAKAYWLLRSARIFPLYFALLVLFALRPPGFGRDAQHVILNWPLPYLTFTSNYFAQGTLELGVFWSLAIEEQFYLAVGLLVLFCASRRETLASALMGLSLAAIAVSLVYRHEILLSRGEGWLPENMYIFKLFHSTLSRMDQLAVGLLSALVAPRFNRWSLARSSRWAGVTTWLAVAVCLGTLTLYPHQPVVGFLVLGVVFAACLLWVQRPAARERVLSRWESVLLAPIAQIGKLSFGLYLFHAIVRPWVDRALPLSVFPAGSAARAWVFLPAWGVFAVAIAAMSYRFIEEPLLAAARRKAREWMRPRPAAPEETAAQNLLTAAAAGTPVATGSADPSGSSRMDAAAPLDTPRTSSGPSAST